VAELISLSEPPAAEGSGERADGGAANA
jgi:hypothetical protein